MLSLEHLQVDDLLTILVVTALALVSLRVTSAVARRLVERDGERALAHADHVQRENQSNSESSA